MINSVKEQQEGYLLNGVLTVPIDNENRHYKLIKQWIDEGNTPEPQYTAAEQTAKDAAEAKAAAEAELRQMDLDSIRAIREYIASKPDAPQILKEREAAAAAARVKLA